MTNNEQPHICEKIPEIITLQKDVENHTARIVIIENKNDKLGDSITDIRDFRTMQMETNKYLSKVVSQNEILLQRLDSKYDKLEQKYDKDIEDNKQKINSLEIEFINANNLQNATYNADKLNLTFKIIGWSFGALTTLALFIWKILPLILGL